MEEDGDPSIDKKEESAMETEDGEEGEIIDDDDDSQPLPPLQQQQDSHQQQEQQEPQQPSQSPPSQQRDRSRDRFDRFGTTTKKLRDRRDRGGRVRDRMIWRKRDRDNRRDSRDRERDRDRERFRDRDRLNRRERDRDRRDFRLRESRDRDRTRFREKDKLLSIDQSHHQHPHRHQTHSSNQLQSQPQSQPQSTQSLPNLSTTPNDSTQPTSSTPTTTTTTSPSSTPTTDSLSCQNNPVIPPQLQALKDTERESEKSPKNTCRFYLDGKCHKGADCPFPHDTQPPKKKDICKFYLQGFCGKGDGCLFMHGEFPCKFYHTGAECYSGDKCRFSHEPLTEETRALLKNYLDSGELPDEVNRGDGTNNRPKKPAILGDPSDQMKTSYYTWLWQQEMKELEIAYTGTKRNLFLIDKEFTITEQPPQPVGDPHPYYHRDKMDMRPGPEGPKVLSYYIDTMSDLSSKPESGPVNEDDKLLEMSFHDEDLRLPPPSGIPPRLPPPMGTPMGPLETHQFPGIPPNHLSSPSLPLNPHQPNSNQPPHFDSHHHQQPPPALNSMPPLPSIPLHSTNNSQSNLPMTMIPSGPPPLLPMQPKMMNTDNDQSSSYPTPSFVNNNQYSNLSTPVIPEEMPLPPLTLLQRISNNQKISASEESESNEFLFNEALLKKEVLDSGLLQSSDQSTKPVDDAGGEMKQLLSDSDDDTEDAPVKAALKNLKDAPNSTQPPIKLESKKDKTVKSKLDIVKMLNVIRQTTLQVASTQPVASSNDENKHADFWQNILSGTNLANNSPATLAAGGLANSGLDGRSLAPGSGTPPGTERRDPRLKRSSADGDGNSPFQDFLLSKPSEGLFKSDFDYQLRPMIVPKIDYSIYEGLFNTDVRMKTDPRLLNFFKKNTLKDYNPLND